MANLVLPIPVVPTMEINVFTVQISVKFWQIKNHPNYRGDFCLFFVQSLVNRTYFNRL